MFGWYGGSHFKGLEEAGVCDEGGGFGLDIPSGRCNPSGWLVGVEDCGGVWNEGTPCGG